MRSFNGTVAVAALVVLAGVAGTGLVAAEDLESANDGDISNGEELKSAEDDDDQVYPINYTFRLANNQPGAVDGAAEHYAVGLTENGTLHRVLLYSPDMGFSNCEPGDTSAFGIDRGNNDPGTETDVSLLTSFKSYNSTEDFIDIKYYREETLAGEPVNGSVYDQIVAAQGNCYDNPSEPGWYRINGTITGNVAGGTETDYKIRDLSNYVYICDCDSRAAAEGTLGPPPNESGDGGDGGDGSDGTDGSSTPARTTTPTATAAPSDDDATTATPTPTAAPSDEETVTATPTPTATATPTPTATPTVTAASAGRDTPTVTAVEAGGRGTGTAALSTTAGGGSSGQQQGGAPATPTIADGPGFGALMALIGALLATVVLARRD